MARALVMVTSFFAYVIYFCRSYCMRSDRRERKKGHVLDDFPKKKKDQKKSKDEKFKRRNYGYE